MANAADVAEAVLTLLKTSQADGAKAIRALLVSGADSIVEAWDYEAETLTALEEARRLLPEAQQGKALLLSVEDLGNDPSESVRGAAVESVGIRIIDRGRGYANIRQVRLAIFGWLFSEKAWRDAVLGDDSGLLSLDYGGRSGQAYSATNDIQLEAIAVKAQMLIQLKS